MGGGRKSSNSGPSSEQLAEQRRVADAQLELERQRIALERQARATAEQELNILSTQLGEQRQAYENQLGILQQQQAIAEQAAADTNVRLEAQTAALNAARQQQQTEASRAAFESARNRRNLLDTVLTQRRGNSSRRRQNQNRVGLLSTVLSDAERRNRLTRQS